MSHDIKQLKPQADGRYYQGHINPASCKKLFPSQSNQPIIFRSSYERSFINWLESNPNVKAWGSECVGIKYKYIDNKVHTYYPDFVVEMMNGDKIVVEIKPYNQTQKPDMKNDWSTHTYIRNMCKWKAAKEICEKNGMKFQIITEKTISKLGYDFARYTC